MPRLLQITCILVCATVAQLPAAPAWDERDTQIANQYVQILEATPQAGQVLDLLWAHYQKHAATATLLDHYREKAAAAEPGDGAPPQVIYGLLLWKAGELEAAAAQLRGASRWSLRASAELAVERHDFATARDAYAKLGDEALVDLARMQLQTGDRRSAARQLARAFELGTDLREKQIIARLTMQTGAIDVAIAQFRELQSAGEAGDRAAALRELARLYELDQQFGNAEATLRAGMDLTHFRHPLHRDFFTRLVRLDERNAGLDRLGASLQAEANDEPGLYRLVLFYELTVDPDGREAALRQLARINPGYRPQLADLLIQRGDELGAARVLDDLLDEQSDLGLVLKRAGIDLRVEGKAAAARRIDAWLTANPDDAQARDTIKTFAAENYIDRIAERLLKRSEGEGSALELASFYLERERPAEAQAVLEVFAEDEPRSLAAARLLLTHKEFTAAQSFVAGLPRSRQVQLELATILDASGERERAIAELKKAIPLGTVPAQWQEIDELLINMLDAAGLEAGQRPTSPLDELAPGSSENPFPDLTRGSDPGVVIPRFTARVHQHQQRLAALAETDLDLWRNAWWSHRTFDLAAANQAITELLERDSFPVEARQLATEIAIDAQDPDLAIQHLETLCEIDRENLEFHSLELARLLQETGRPIAAAVLAQIPADDPVGLRVLQSADPALASAKFAEFDPGTRARLLDAYTQQLVRSGQIGAALQAYTEALELESDPERKRQLFAQQLKLATREEQLPWMTERYRRMGSSDPLDGFLNEALARIHRERGDVVDALESMRSAYYNSPPGDGARLLPELRDLCVAADELGDAIYFQRQILSASGEAAAGEWQRLVGLLEKDLRIAEATRVQGLLDRKLAREPAAASEQVARYFERGQSENARQLLDAVVRLRPWEARSQFLLGLLQRRAGEVELARASFEAALKHSARTAGEPPPTRTPPFTDHRSPDGEDLLDRLASAENLEWEELAELEASCRLGIDAFRVIPASERGLRLRTIQELAELHPQNTSWRERWEAAGPDPSERVWALFYSGHHAAAAQALGRDPTPESRLLDSLVVIRCRANPEDIEPRMFAAAIQVLTHEESFDFSSLDFRALVAGGLLSNLQAWQLARQLADAGRHREAIAIGEAIAPATLSSRPLYSLRDWKRRAAELAKSDVSVADRIAATSELNPRLQRILLRRDDDQESAIREFLNETATPRPLSLREGATRDSSWSDVLYSSRAARTFAGRELADAAIDSFLSQRPLKGGADEREQSAYNDFALERLLWRFPELPLPERLRATRQLAAGNLYYDEVLRIADALDRRGYDREALDTYHSMIRRFPEDSAFDHGRLLGTCAEVEDYVLALQHIDRLRANPADLGLGYIYQQHAKFLAMAGDTDRLHLFGTLPGSTMPARRPYIDALAEFHHGRGQWQAALEAIGLAGAPSEPDIDRLLFRGECQLRLGHLATALDTLGKIPLLRADHTVETGAIRLRVEAYLAADRLDEQALRRLLARATDYEDPQLLLDLAAATAGRFPSETMAMLRLAAPKFGRGAGRFAVQLEILALRPSREELEHALAHWAEHPAHLRRLVEITRVKSQPDWRAELLEKLERPGRRTLPAALTLFAMAEVPVAELDWAVEAFANAPGLEPAGFGVGLETLLTSGRAAAAETLLGRIPETRPQIPLRTDQRLSVAHHRGDHATVQAIFIDAIRHAETSAIHGALETDLPRQFAALGHVRKARELFDRQHAHLRSFSSGKHLKFYHAYFYFLVATGDFRTAERILMQCFEQLVAAKPQRIADLYRAWGKLESLEEELPKFHLTPGQRLRLQHILAQDRG